MLKDIAVYLRAMQLYYHSAHNLSKGLTFNQDHATFNNFYLAMEEAYDSVIERAIRLEGEQSADLKEQMKGAYLYIKDKPTVGADNKVFLEEGLKCEINLCKMIEDHCKIPECTEAVKQLLGEISNQSDIRQYLLSQRLK